MFSFVRCLPLASCIALMAIGAGCETLNGAIQELPEFEPVDSTLQKFTETLSKKDNRGELFSMSTDGGKLKVDFAKGQSDARELLMSVSRDVPGARGSSSSSSGGTTWSLSISGPKLNVRAGHGRQYWNPTQEMVFMNNANAFYLQLMEVGGKDSQVFVTATSATEFNVRLNDNNGNQIFRFRQSGKGKIDVIDVSPDFQFRDQAASFEEFAARNPDYLTARLMPLFIHCGVGEPPTRFHSFVRDTVVFGLVPLAPSMKKEFDELVADMDASEFKVREEATKNLDAQFDKWENVIQTAQADSKYSIEVRSRLKKMYSGHVDKFRRGMMQIVNKFDLGSDPDYLIWLLQQTESLEPKQIDAVMERLQSVTGKSFSDTEEWLSWQDKNEKPIVATSVSGWKEVLDSKGILDDVRQDLGQLVRLKVDNGNLMVDRDYWKECLGGKTVKEHKEEIKAILAERNLPVDWLKLGGGMYPETSVEFPQIIFERITDGKELEQNYASMLQNYSRYTLNTGNREFLGKAIFGRMKVHQYDRRRMFTNRSLEKTEPIKHDRLTLELGESQDQQRRIMFSDDLKGNLSVMIELEKLNAMTQLVQKANPDKQGNRTFLIQAVGNDLGVFSAENFSKLKAKMKKDHPATWGNFQKLYVKFGIDLDIE